MLSPSFARSAAMLIALWLTPLVAHAQGAPPPSKPAPAHDAKAADAAKKPADPKTPAAGDKPAPKAGEGEGEAAGPKDSPEVKGDVKGDATDAATPPVEGAAKTIEPPPDGGESGDDDDDDVWGEAEGDEEPYVAPMVDPDYEQAQLPGYTHEKHHMHRWVYHNLFAVRVNPLGLTNRFRTGYQMQLSNKPEPIFHESFVSVELDTEITPSFGYVGGRLDFQPVKLLTFSAAYGGVGFFNTFNHTTSFADATAEYSDDDLDTYDRECDPLSPSEPCQYSTYGNRAILSGRFQVGIGGLVLRDKVEATWMSMKLTDGDQVFWYATHDLLFPNSGWVVTNDADLLFITDWDWPGDAIVGVRHTVTHALYRSEHLGGGKNVNTPTHRIGPAIGYKFFEDGPGTDFDKPTLLVLSQWWVKHRYRTTQSPALPYVVLAFLFEGDLMVSDKE